MKTIEIAGKTLTVKGELSNGAFYLEGPRGGSAVFAKPASDGSDLYFFYKATGGPSIQERNGFASKATRAQLAA